MKESRYATVSVVSSRGPLTTKALSVKSMLEISRDNVIDFIVITFGFSSMSLCYAAFRQCAPAAPVLSLRVLSSSVAIHTRSSQLVPNVSIVPPPIVMNTHLPYSFSPIQNDRPHRSRASRKSEPYKFHEASINGTAPTIGI